MQRGTEERRFPPPWVSCRLYFGNPLQSCTQGVAQRACPPSQPPADLPQSQRCAAPSFPHSVRIFPWLCGLAFTHLLPLPSPSPSLQISLKDQPGLDPNDQNAVTEFLDKQVRQGVLVVV